MAPVATPTGQCTGDSSTFTFVLDNIGKTVGCKWLTQNSSKMALRKMTYCGRTNVSGGCCSTCGTVTAPVVPPVTAPVTAPITAPVTAPITAPIVPPVTAPVTAPVIAPVSTPVMTPVATPTGQCTGDSSTFTFVLDNGANSVKCKWLTQNIKKIVLRKGKYCSRAEVSVGCCDTCS